MLNMKNLFTRALLALMLVTGAGAALAGPTYHVTLNTAGYDGTGAIDFILTGYDTQASTAFLSNFTGDFLSGSDTVGDVSGSIDTGLVIRAGEDFGEFAQKLNLGQRFGFDVSFDTGMGNLPVGFTVGVFSDTLGTWLGATGNLVAFDLTPGQPALVDVDAPFANAGLVSEVPEPATLASLALGLALMGSTLRARRKQ